MSVFPSFFQRFRPVLGTAVRSRTELEREPGLLRTLISNIPDLVWIKDPDGVYLACNPRFEGLYGVSEAELIGKTDYDFVARETADLLRAHDRLVMEKSCPSMNEEWATFADGHRELLETIKTPVFDAQGRLIGVLGTSHDITERKQAERELAGHCQHLERLVDQLTGELQASQHKLADINAEFIRAQAIVHVGSWRIDLAGNTLSWSEETYRIFGIPSGTPVNLAGFVELIHPDDRESVLQAWNGALGGKPYDIRHRIVVAGEVRWVRERAEVLFDQDGKACYGVGAVQDITQSQRTEEGMQAALAETHRLAQVKSEFLANMSHEIRTPLNAILGLSHLLRNDVHTDLGVERLGKIDTAGRHLLAVINDILDLSKIEAGRLSLEARDFSLAALLDRVSTLIGEEARAKDLAIVIETDDVPLWLRGDVTRLQQALLNYAGNAIKFTPNGTITLRARLLERRDGQVHVRFEVQDTGIGIDAAAVPRLFRAFEQADASTTRKFGGSGLGLAITQRLAQLMKGEVGADSTLGHGSTFWLSVWLELGQPVAEEVTPASGGEAELRLRHAGARVLLVEDNPINREVAAELLEGAGLAVENAANGRIAVERVQSESFDLVLMDIQMPEMDGIEATRAIRCLKGREELPVLAMSANIFDDDRQQCLAAGMNDFVAKPVDAQRLFATLLKWLPKRGSTAAAAAPPVVVPADLAAAASDAAFARLSQDAGMDVVQGLEMLRGNQDRYLKVLHQLVDLHGNDMQLLRDALANGERIKAHRIAHSLKGVAANLGANELARAAKAVDEVLRGPAADDENERLKPLLADVERVLARLQALLAG